MVEDHFGSQILEPAIFAKALRPIDLHPWALLLDINLKPNALKIHAGEEHWIYSKFWRMHYSTEKKRDKRKFREEEENTKEKEQRKRGIATEREYGTR